MTVAVTENMHFGDPAIPGEVLVQNCPCSVADEGRAGSHNQDPHVHSVQCCSWGTKPHMDSKDSQAEWFGENRGAAVISETICVKTRTFLLFFGMKNNFI